jgi:hypothetical protein
MREGWHGDLILFDESEAVAASDRYELLRLLPGFNVLGLRSGDDFIRIVFGGEAGVGENLVWISYEEHAQLVKL